ncbi:MAG: 50S ribosomal protein L16 [Nanoarchaeota archaeon]|nr:50S ribosomal protein L16 [Nanoarchaeota archaeon]MCG2717889.1 50S ribosomal protein L16 [Nanoarchaeota archaeon]
MAGLRKGHAYSRTVKRAFTRKSKFKKKGYIKAVPITKIVKHDMGDLKKEFPKQVHLVTKQPVTIRHNALESVRMLVNRRIVKEIGTNYKFKLRVYPHHVLRENKMLTGAGADRMQSGMQRAYGKAMGIAVQAKKGQKIFTIYVDEDCIEKAKKALKLATTRLPMKYSIETE